MISERELWIMEQGAAPEVELLCAEVRRLYAGIRSVLATYKSRDHAAPLVELSALLSEDA